MSRSSSRSSRALRPMQTNDPENKKRCRLYSCVCCLLCNTGNNHKVREGETRPGNPEPPKNPQQQTQAPTQQQDPAHPARRPDQPIGRSGLNSKCRADSGGRPMAYGFGTQGRRARNPTGDRGAGTHTDGHRRALTCKALAGQRGQWGATYQRG